MNRCVSVLVAWAVCLLLLAMPARAVEPAPTPAATAPPPPPERFFGLPRGNRWLAAGLSLGFNGLGQLYNNDPAKGYGMMAAWLSFPLGYGLDALTGRAYGRLFSYSANVGVKVWSVVDAYQNAVVTPSPTPSPVPVPSPSPSSH